MRWAPGAALGPYGHGGVGALQTHGTGPARRTSPESQRSRAHQAGMLPVVQL
jgi:hypothetical protein